jgi:hypothetical protein
MEINAAWEQCNAIFFERLRNNVPTMKIKDGTKSLPWLNKCLRKLMAQRDKLFAAWHSCSQRALQKSA